MCDLYWWCGWNRRCGHQSWEKMMFLKDLDPKDFPLLFCSGDYCSGGEVWPILVQRCGLVELRWPIVLGESLVRPQYVWLLTDQIHHTPTIQKINSELAGILHEKKYFIAQLNYFAKFTSVTAHWGKHQRKETLSQMKAQYPILCNMSIEHPSQYWDWKQ